MTLHTDDSINPRVLIASALDWWREAGVDHAFIDDPQVWLAQEQAEGAAAKKPLARLAPVELPEEAPKAPVRLGGEPSQWPQSFEEFARWWLTEPSLDPAPSNRRVPPAGVRGADLMVLVPMPEDGDESVLLSGRAGKLLDAMLSAMGLSRDTIYLAAALPARTPAPDWSALQQQGLREVLLHHIALAAPRRLLILGQPVVSTLSGHDPAKKGQNFSSLEQEGSALPVGTGYDLEAMLARPALKAGVWKKWLDWTGNTES